MFNLDSVASVDGAESSANKRDFFEVSVVPPPLGS
jgi:hypothetical protein